MHLSYSWSLPVTWQRWRSRNSIRHIQKLNATCKPHVLQSYSYRRLKFYIAGIAIFDFFAPVTRWPSYMYINLTRISGIWARMCKYKLPTVRQGFRKLSSSDSQTDRHDRNYIPPRAVADHPEPPDRGNTGEKGLYRGVKGALKGSYW